MHYSCTQNYTIESFVCMKVCVHVTFLVRVRYLAHYCVNGEGLNKSRIGPSPIPLLLFSIGTKNDGLNKGITGVCSFSLFLCKNILSFTFCGVCPR